MRRRDLRERALLLGEVERVDDAVGARVRGAETAETPDVLDELDDAAELVLRVRDVAGRARHGLARVGRNDQHRNAESQTAPMVEWLRRLHLIVEPAPIVPRDDDGRRSPVIAAL